MNSSPTTTPKPFCFVLMPFKHEFDDVYKLGIKESCELAGAYCERVDEQLYDKETILQHIYSQIYKADFIIAELTGRNENVFYEVGYAHALGKSTILITEDSNDIPFDFKHFPHIIYKKSITYLREKLTEHIKWLIENLKEGKEPRVGIEIYLDSNNLTNEGVEFLVEEGSSPTFQITLYNNSIQTIESRFYQVGIITSPAFTKCYDYRSIDPEVTDGIKQPDGNYIHMLPGYDNFFPFAFTSISLMLDGKVENEFEDIILRVFTSSGFRDFYLRLKSIPKAE